MCQFVLITLPKDADIPVIQPQLKACRFEFHDEPELGPKKLERLFRVGRISQAQCDCGTVVGLGTEKLELEKVEVDNTDQRHIEKLRRKGWSDAKINRWLLQTQANRQYLDVQHNQMCENRDEEAQVWAKALRATFLATRKRHVGLFHCELGGRQRPKIDGAESLPIERLTSGFIINARSHVHYSFE